MPHYQEIGGKENWVYCCSYVRGHRLFMVHQPHHGEQQLTVVTIHRETDSCYTVSTESTDSRCNIVPCGVVCTKLFLLAAGRVVPPSRSLPLSTSLQELADGRGGVWLEAEADCLALHGIPERMTEDAFHKATNSSKVVLWE